MQIPDNSLAVVVTVRPESSSLDAVKELARANSGTLGFLPAGAFQAAAEEGHLIAAQNMNGEVSGYLLFRVAANRASIIHLCVASSYRIPAPRNR